MEHSHRGKAYEEVHNRAIALVRELLGVPESHHVLFCQGGASQQFAMVPMNFLPAGRSADYLSTGHWSARAIDEARLLGRIRLAAATEMRMPKPAEVAVDPEAAYLHITTNETIEGSQLRELPDPGAVPLVADMSSDFLSRRIDVSRFALIYAGAQKNVGPSGVVVVIVRKDWLDRARTDIPIIFRYATFAKGNSLYNTPPTFGIYLMKNVLEWMRSVGGLAEIEARNVEKARLLYETLEGDATRFRLPVEQSSRSLMNVVWRLTSEAEEERFVKEATAAGLVGLKGHRSVGGLRASLYNAVSVDDVKRLCSFLTR
jgi:phosphoserine aminotransferase